MSEVIISALVLAAEVAALLVALAAIALAVAVVRSRRRRAHARSFVRLVEERERERRERLRAECADAASEEGERRVQAVQDQERRLYARILALFRGAGQAALRGIEQEVDRLVAVSRELGPTPRPAAPEPLDQARVPLLEARLSEAQEEGQRLRAQLKDTQEALDQLHQEYEALYERERSRARAR